MKSWLKKQPRKPRCILWRCACHCISTHRRCNSVPVGVWANGKPQLQLSFRVQYKVKATSSIFSLSTVSLFANQVVSTHLKLGHMSTNVSTLDLLVVAATCGVRKSNYLSWRQLVCFCFNVNNDPWKIRLHWKDVKAAFCVITREHGKENK